MQLHFLTHLIENFFINENHLISFVQLLLLLLNNLNIWILVSLNAGKTIIDLSLVILRDCTISNSAQNLGGVTGKLVDWLIVIIRRHSPYLMRIMVVLISLNHLSHRGIPYLILRLYWQMLLHSRRITYPWSPRFSWAIRFIPLVTIRTLRIYKPFIRQKVLL